MPRRAPALFLTNPTNLRRGLRDDVGDRVAGRLQAQRKAAAQHDAADARVYAKPVQVKAPGTVHVREAQRNCQLRQVTTLSMISSIQVRISLIHLR